MTALQKTEERYPLKGEKFVHKCEEQVERSQIWNRIMTTPNFTVLVIIVALVCFLGESLVQAKKLHSTILVTDPDSLSILKGHNAQVKYTYKPDITQSFTVYLNTSKELSVDPASLQFSGSANSQKVTIKGLSVTSRGYVDVQNCTKDQDHTPCDFALSDIFVTVKVAHSNFLATLIEITGWVYFIAWSVSFWPQIVLNFRRRSVEGLNFDFLLLNLIGFFCYSVYNVMMFFDLHVQDLYVDANPRSQIPVLMNDVVFALHALLACIITGLQCFIYERANQRVSYTCMGWSTLLVGFSIVSFALTIFHVLNWLKFIYFLSYVKMAVTLSKYLPQALMNYRRKSTVGWSIGNILLDFTGGSMDIVQMVLQGANTNDWSGFAGNPVKFGLGLVSMIFDVVFMSQHYCLYRHSEAYEIRHEANASTETVVQDPTREDDETGDAAFDNGVYH